MEGSSIAVRVPFAFYAEAVNAKQNNQLLSTLMSEVLGSSVRMQAVYEAPARAVIDSVRECVRRNGRGIISLYFIFGALTLRAVADMLARSFGDRL